MEESRAILTRHIARLSEGYPLREFSPLGTGGTADYFTVAASAVDVASAVRGAIAAGVPYLVVGSGSRTVFSDGGYPGLVIHNRTEGYGISRDRSQAVVDAGMPLSRFITLLAGQGLGGLTPFYGSEETVGGAVYNDLTREGRSILSNLRYITAVMPPTRLDAEPTVNRYKREWLGGEGGRTRLRELKEEAPPDRAQPVLLTAMFQLTSVRPDELLQRLQGRAGGHARPSGPALGPVFEEPADVPLREMLAEVRASRLRVGSLVPDPRHPLYLRARGPVRAADARELIGKLQEAVSARYGFVPASRYEYLGVW